MRCLRRAVLRYCGLTLLQFIQRSIFSLWWHQLLCASGGWRAAKCASRKRGAMQRASHVSYVVNVIAMCAAMLGTRCSRVWYATAVPLCNCIAQPHLRDIGQEQAVDEKLNSLNPLSPPPPLPPAPPPAGALLPLLLALLQPAAGQASCAAQLQQVSPTTTTEWIDAATDSGSCKKQLPGGAYQLVMVRMGCGRRAGQSALVGPTGRH